MIRHWSRLLFIVALCAPLVGAVETDASCSAKLAGDRYFAPFKGLLESGIIPLGALEQALVSEIPTNPLLHETPTAKNSGAQRLFAALVANSEVRENWPVTKDHLRALYARLTGLAGQAQAAHEATQKIIAPNQVANFATGYQCISLTTLPDGQLAVATIDNQTLLVSTPTGEKIFSEKLPNLIGWKLAFHRQGEDLFLYIAGSEPDDQGRGEKVQVHRLDWKDKELKRLNPRKEIPGEPTDLISVGPGYVLMKTRGGGGKALYNLAGRKIEELPAVSWLERRHWAVTAAGKLVQRNDINRGGNQEALFTTPSGKTYRIRGEDKKLTIVDENDQPVLDRPLTISQGTVDDIMLTEMPGGDTLLAVNVQSRDARQDVVSTPQVFRLSADSRKPIFKRQYKGPVGGFHFFIGADQRPHLGFDHLGQLVIVDLTSGDEVLRTELEGGIDGWLSFNDEVFFYFSKANRTYLYSLFAKF